MKKRILIVEDEPLIGEDIKQSLLGFGYDIPALVGTGEEAVKEAEIHQPDLILMDIFLMGEMDGIEAANIIRSRFNIPVVYLTASSDVAVLDRVRISEPYAFIIKPYKERELHTNIEIALNKHSMEKRLEFLNTVLTALKNTNQLIAKARKSKPLLQGVCDVLTETKSCYTAWIVSIDSSGILTLSAYSRPGEGFKLLSEEFASGYIPACVKKTLAHSHVVSGEVTGSSCKKCPMSGYHKGKGILSARLSHENKIYGVLNVTIPREFLGLKEEKDLIKEVADDIAFALHKIQLEEANRKAEESLRASEEKFAKTFFSSPALMAIIAIDNGRIVDVNHTFVDVLGYTREELIGRTTGELNLWVKPGELQRFIDTPDKHKEVHNMEIDTRRKSGNICHTLFSGVIIHLNGEPHLLSIATDITERKKLEEQLHTAAITDDLTGLYNRRGFFTLAQQQCKLADRTKRKMSLLYMDLDNMKTINDRFGHGTGDEALVDTANIIKGIFRKSDIIGRIGGDEFAVLLTEHDRDDIENIIRKNIKQKFTRHNKQNRRRYRLSLSIGIAHYDPEDPSSISDLLIKADAAMYKNKRDSKSIKLGKKLMRRKHRRFNIHNYWTKLDESDTCEIKNISLRGMCLKAPQRLPVDSIYRIDISPHINNGALFKGIVVWSSLADTAGNEVETAPYYEVGLKFVKLNARQESSIDQFISGLSLS